MENSAISIILLTVLADFKFCVVLNRITMARMRACFTLMFRIAILIFCLVVVTCFIRDSLSVRVFINRNHIAAFTGACVACEKESFSNKLQSCAVFHRSFCIISKLIEYDRHKLDYKTLKTNITPISTTISRL